MRENIRFKGGLRMKDREKINPEKIENEKDLMHKMKVEVPHHLRI